MLLWFKLGWRNLWRNKRRTIIELLSITGGVFLGVWWNNFAIGTYDRMIDDGVRMGSGHIGIYHEQYLDYRKTDQVVNTEGIIEDIEKVDNVVGVYPRLNVPSLVRSSRDSRSGVVQGLDFDRELGTNPLLKEKRIVEGTLPEKSNGALMGIKLAEELGLDVGKKFVIMAQGKSGDIESALFRIEGLLQSGVSDIDNGMVLVNRGKIAEVIGYPNSAHEIAILLDHHSHIEDAMPAISDIAQSTTHGKAFHWERAMPELKSSVQMDHDFLIAMMIFLYIIIGIGTINTLLMSVMERIREFGVLRAIGVNRANIRKMVLSEAIVLAFVGAFSGLILGLAASFYFAEVGLDISGYLSEQGMGGTLIEPVLYGGYDPLGMAVFCGGMIVIAILASIYPTHRVLKVRPSEAMRVY